MNHALLALSFEECQRGGIWNCKFIGQGMECRNISRTRLPLWKGPAACARPDGICHHGSASLQFCCDQRFRRRARGSSRPTVAASSCAPYLQGDLNMGAFAE
jgi:hypothetical protein